MPLVFYGSAAYAMFSFGVLATKWPKLMINWELIEAKMPKYRSPRDKRKLAHKLKILAFVVMMSSLGKIPKSCIQQNKKNNFSSTLPQWNIHCTSFQSHIIPKRV